MLDPQDIEAIARRVVELLKEEERKEAAREANRERQKRWYDRRKQEPNAILTLSNAISQENLTLPNGNLTLSNGSHEEKPNAIPNAEDLFKRDPLMVSPTPSSLIPSENKTVRARSRKPVVMSNAVLETLSKDPFYAGIDLVDQATKFERWCKANKKLNTVRRFVNWINRMS